MSDRTPNTVSETVASDPANERRKARRLPLALELSTAIGLALMAGFLFNMSVVTAPALSALSPPQTLAAWKGINSTVRNPLFAGTAFGTAVLVLTCAAVAWRSRLRVWCLSFALLYLIGVIGTTFTVEVGINNAIIAATQPPPELPHMLSTWLLGNHVRALSALAAFVVAWLGFRQRTAHE
ncbi:MAG TPA: anthrone oxygenase family protein [Terriglobia bacterium]|nr:anthrone oxygenase family protein [Terriglobia bacterium]